MKNKKQPIQLVEKIRQEVLKEYTRVPGEDYEEWCEFIRYEIDARLKDAEEEKIMFLKSVKTE